MDKTLINYKGHTYFLHTHLTNGVKRWRCYRRYGKGHCNAFIQTKGDEIIYEQLNHKHGRVNYIPGVSSFPPVHVKATMDADI